MSKLNCRCGEVIRDQSDDQPWVAEILSEQDREVFLEKAVWSGETICTDIEDAKDQVASALCEFARAIYECPSCGRLWVEKLPGSNVFVSFVSESGVNEGVLCSARGKA